ncbi:hypothetical protein BI364_12490 [Acidihalobacter yilgarnensis]|uniref:Uncharacterized protein n=1 Tax=Acidihalobacter yilgarnensis TaxID=2819280 RepID=A0A1D8IQ94_9GAMM|nr:hypothetical protein BI364_12490 [Acidihalobacter yilgarnensis]
MRAGRVNTHISRSKQALTEEHGEAHSVRVSCPAALELEEQRVDGLFVTFLLRIARVACRSLQREQRKGSAVATTRNGMANKFLWHQRRICEDPVRAQIQTEAKGSLETWRGTSSGRGAETSVVPAKNAQKRDTEKRATD